jgi:hypothetical protein
LQWAWLGEIGVNLECGLVVLGGFYELTLIFEEASLTLTLAALSSRHSRAQEVDSD